MLIRAFNLTIAAKLFGVSAAAVNAPAATILVLRSSSPIIAVSLGTIIGNTSFNCPVLTNILLFATLSAGTFVFTPAVIAVVITPTRLVTMP